MLGRKHILKSIVKNVLRYTGWEIYRSDSISHIFMKDGLKWLADHNFYFKTIIDVGASDGRWSKECMAFYPDAKYILFEPNPFFGKALDDFAKSHKKMVTLFKKAVGASVGSALLFFDALDPDGGSLTRKEGYESIKVDLTTLDTALTSSQAEAPYLLKLDTHGVEKSILEGASITLEKCEALIIEAYNFRISEEAFLFWELCYFLSERGFLPIDLVDVKHRNYDNSLWQMDLFFIKSTWEGFNYVSYK